MQLTRNSADAEKVHHNASVYVCGKLL